MILDDKNITHIHLMGIGGIGVSALAEILLKKGYRITGTDVAASKNTERLQKLGVDIVFNHQGTRVTEADIAVYSSGVSKETPEFMAATQAKIPLLSRGQMLAEIMTRYCSTAIAGAHGKTTTSGLLAHTFLTAGLDPSFMVGGVLNDLQTPARVGEGNYFVAEADESDASFLFMHPDYIIITNIDADHLETYGGDFDRLKASYLQFIHQLPPKGIVFLCQDDPVSCELMPKIERQIVTYGYSAEADYQITEYHQLGLSSHFQLKRPGALSTLPVQLNLTGRHNASNAAAVIAMSQTIGIDDALLLKALKEFAGVGRRFHLHGELQINGGGALLLEDYGHHPQEIKVTLAAVRAAWPTRRLVLVFQPHRYSRTRDLMADFAAILKNADLLILLEVYSAGETLIPGADGVSLFNTIKKDKSDNVLFVDKLNDLPEQLKKMVTANDIVLLQGAGDIGKMANILQKLE